MRKRASIAGSRRRSGSGSGVSSNGDAMIRMSDASGEDAAAAVPSVAAGGLGAAVALPAPSSSSTGQELQPSLRGEWANLALLTALYTLQGVPIGLASSVPLFLQSRGASFSAQATFGLSSWPYSLKLLWAPIVDALFTTRFGLGLRKSWIVPVQFLTGAIMLILGSRLNAVFGGSPEAGAAAAEGAGIDVNGLTASFFVLYFLVATQDIAVDGWALTMLRPENVGYASTANTVGQTLGIMLAYGLLMALDSAAFSNAYIRAPLGWAPGGGGVVSMAGFMQFWGCVFIASTGLLWALKTEGTGTGGQAPHTVMAESTEFDATVPIMASVIAAGGLPRVSGSSSSLHSPQLGQQLYAIAAEGAVGGAAAGAGAQPVQLPRRRQSSSGMSSRPHAPQNQHQLGTDNAVRGLGGALTAGALSGGSAAPRARHSAAATTGGATAPAMSAPSPVSSSASAASPSLGHPASAAGSPLHQLISAVGASLGSALQGVVGAGGIGPASGSPSASGHRPASPRPSPRGAAAAAATAAAPMRGLGVRDADDEEEEKEDEEEPSEETPLGGRGRGAGGASSLHPLHQRRRGSASRAAKSGGGGGEGEDGAAASPSRPQAPVLFAPRPPTQARAGGGDDSGDEGALLGHGRQGQQRISSSSSSWSASSSGGRPSRGGALNTLQPHGSRSSGFELGGDAGDGAGPSCEEDEAAAAAPTPPDASLVQHSTVLGSLLSAYRDLGRLFTLWPVRSLALVLFTAKAGFSVTDAATSIMVQSRGVPKETIAMFDVISTPLQLGLQLAVSRATAGPRPLSLFLYAFPARILCGLAYLWILFYALKGAAAPQEGAGASAETASAPTVALVAYFLLSNVHSLVLGVMFLSQISFFNRVSDPLMGGTYMTLLNTVANLGNMWPRWLAMNSVQWLTRSQCLPSAPDAALGGGVGTDPAAVAAAVSAAAGIVCGAAAERKAQCAALSSSAAGAYSCQVTQDGYVVMVLLSSVVALLWWAAMWGRVKRLEDAPRAAWLYSTTAAAASAGGAAAAAGLSA